MEKELLDKKEERLANIRIKLSGVPLSSIVDIYKFIQQVPSKAISMGFGETEETAEWSRGSMVDPKDLPF